MSLYKVHFTWQKKDVILKARNLDLTHPYFVSIKDLVFSSRNSLIIDPTEDDLKNTFGKTDHVMIPFQTVLLIEEIKEESIAERPFSVLK